MLIYSNKEIYNKIQHSKQQIIIIIGSRLFLPYSTTHKGENSLILQT